MEVFVALGADFNNPDSLTKALPYLATGFPQTYCDEAKWMSLTYKTELYYEDRFIKRLSDGQGENPPILVVRLTTSGSIAENPLAYLNFYNNLIKTRKPVPEKKAFGIMPSMPPGAIMGTFDSGRAPIKVLPVIP